MRGLLSNLCKSIKVVAVALVNEKKVQEELLGDLWFGLKVTVVAFINGKKALEMVQEHPLRES